MFLSQVEILQQKLTQRPLIGEPAHNIVEAVAANGVTFKRNQITALTKRSAVLILLYPEQEQVHFSLILRPEYKGIHSGQVALPGGRQEPQDENLIVTALRETQEEIGVPAQSVQVIKPLSDLYVFASDHIVTPVVGFVKEKPNFQLQEREVAALIPVELEHFLQLSIQTTQLHVGNFAIKAPYFPIKSHIVWGATAAILNEFKMLLSH
jgi:8-oxo-dGTP pyrophosphatase MutT (NUDIX family)